MSRIALGAAVLIAASWAASAQAADPPYGSPYTNNQPVFGKDSWAAPYVGGNLGWAWGSVDNNLTQPSGLAGGVQAGFNWHSPGAPWVVGIEGDIQATGASDTFAPWKFSNPWFGTLRARAGLAISSVLFYGTAGLAYGTLNMKNTLTSVSESHTSTGWAGGVGVEAALTGNWSARAEYLYVDLSSSSFVLDGNSHGIQSNLLRFGVNYRF